jgi:hypothetical protein
MNLILIQCDVETLNQLRTLPDVVWGGPTGAELPEGQLEVSAYANDADLEEIRSRGGLVTVLQDSATREGELQELYALIDRSDDPVG